MDKKEFAEVFSEVIDNLNETDFSKEKMAEYLNEFTSESGTIAQDDLMLALSVNSMKYAKYLVEDVFVKLIEKGLLK